jgi:S1-C subfamily serine protease
MRPFTAIFLAVILAFLNGCQKDTSVSKISNPITAPKIEEVVVNPDPFPGFEIVNNNTQNKYGCVGHVHNERGEFIGSGVLIAPTIVLTAGHVIDGDELRYFITGDAAYLIEKSILHPGYKTGEDIVNDIGILILSEGCDITPAVMIKSGNELTQRESLTTVGYSHQVKKASKYGTFWYYGTVEEEPQYIKFLPIKGHIWFGDSGGAVFEEGGHLAGIISSMTVIQDTMVDQSAIRVDKYQDWITETVQNEGCSFE